MASVAGRASPARLHQRVEHGPRPSTSSSASSPPVPAHSSVTSRSARPAPRAWTTRVDERADEDGGRPAGRDDRAGAVRRRQVHRATCRVGRRERPGAVAEVESRGRRDSSPRRTATAPAPPAPPPRRRRASDRRESPRPRPPGPPSSRSSRSTSKTTTLRRSMWLGMRSDGRRRRRRSCPVLPESAWLRQVCRPSGQQGGGTRHGVFKMCDEPCASALLWQDHIDRVPI